MIRCQTGRKFSIQSLFTTSTSFGTVCTDGRDIVESADRGMKVFDKAQFDFSWVQPFEFVVLLSDSFIVDPKSWAWFKALNVLCWSEKQRVGFPPVLSEVFCTSIQTLSTSSFASLCYLFSQTYLFRAYFKSVIKISKGFNKRTCFRKTGLNTILIASIVRTATSVTTMIFRKYKLHVL